MTFDDYHKGRLRVLCVHNAYQHAGGEDSVFQNEALLLEAAGHVVERVRVSNNGIGGPITRTTAALEATYSLRGRGMIRRKIADFRPNVVHVHNFFPRLSPAVFDACNSSGVASVWTLHNFRVACANGLLFRDGKICEDCVGNLPLPAIRHRCYHNSYIGTVAVAAMIGYHSLSGTWRRKVDRFIALNDFARDLFVRSGLPAERVVIKPNFSSPIREPTDHITKRVGALFVGRLSQEKGVRTLVEAWTKLDVPLTILGDGPERAALEKIAPSHVSFSGFADRETVAAAMTTTQALIVPSVWYENFPMTLVEAMSAGTPVIASRLGSLPGIVKDGVTGLHFSAGDASDLAKVASAAFARPDELARLGESARTYWQAHMSPESNLRQLETIYEAAIAEAALR